jgi:hypothetical protein
MERNSDGKREILILDSRKFLAYVSKRGNVTLQLKVNEKYGGIEEIKKKLKVGIDRDR